MNFPCAFCRSPWIPSCGRTCVSVFFFLQLTVDSLKMVRDQVLVVTEKGETETDKGIVIAAAVSAPGIYPITFMGGHGFSFPVNLALAPSRAPLFFTSDLLYCRGICVWNGDALFQSWIVSPVMDSLNGARGAQGKPVDMHLLPVFYGTHRWSFACIQ